MWEVIMRDRARTWDWTPTRVSLLAFQQLEQLESAVLDISR